MSAPWFAIVAHDGVVRAEADAFAAVFGGVPGARVDVVGARVGSVVAAGGELSVTARFEDVFPDVIAVPGGLGSHRHLAIAAWVAARSPRFVVASSTGVALLAAGGLLAGRRVTTHWLAGPLVRSYGATVVDDRIVVDDRYVTCQGSLSAIEASLLVVAAIGGQRLADTARANLVAVPTEVRCRRTRRRWSRRRSMCAADPWAPVEIELDEHDPTGA